MILVEDYFKKVYHQGLPEISEEIIYGSFFREVVPMLEEKKGFKPIFGNIDGSVSRGMSNDTSDIDIHVFGKTDNSEITYELMYAEADYQGNKIVFDIAPHNMEITRQSLIEYNRNMKQYPTVFYRTADEKKIYSSENIHWNIRFRPDGEIFELMQFLIADTIFIRKSHYGQEQLEEFYRSYKTVDMLDLQFVRAYGNYNNLMKNGQKTVLARKYLYTLYEIFFCLWIIRHKTRPPLDFMKLLEGQDLAQQVYDSITTIFEFNKKAKEHKSKQMYKSCAVLNKYISDCLNDLKSAMACYNTTEVYGRIVRNTEKSMRQKIYYF